MNHSILSFREVIIDCGYSWVLQRQSTESEKTYTFAVDSLTALSFNKVVLKTTNIIKGYLQVVVSQSYTNEILCRFRNKFHCTGVRIYI